MKRLTLTAGFVLAVAVPAGSAQALTHAEAVSYGRAYAHAVDKFGQRSAGCKLIGPRSTCAGQRTDARVRASIGVLHRMFAPRPVVHYSAPSYSSSNSSYHPSSTSYGGGGAAGVPACASESGTNYSTGPDNTNPSSGATGRYQILPSTAAGYGCDLSTPAGQDACAGRIYRAAGASQWVGCGG